MDVNALLQDKEGNILSFHKTLILVKLMELEEDFLISRSQAKRLINRFDKFVEVVLDFDGVTQIGQAFADQIFRVFQNKHPNVHLSSFPSSCLGTHRYV